MKPRHEAWRKCSWCKKDYDGAVVYWDASGHYYSDSCCLKGIDQAASDSEHKEWEVTIKLPFVGGDAEHPGDDETMVSVRQQVIGKPIASLAVSSTGPTIFEMLGFDVAGLRKLATFLDECACELDREGK